jgi:hypothetical protein
MHQIAKAPVVTTACRWRFACAALPVDCEMYHELLPPAFYRGTALVIARASTTDLTQDLWLQPGA